MTTTPVTGIIYDMDGLLLDTEGIYTEVTRQIVGRFGKTYDWSIKQHMIGRPALESARYLVEALGLPIRAEQYLEERESLLREQFPFAAAMPGAERLVRHLHAHGVPQAVATSSSELLFRLKTLRHDWFVLFDAVVTGDDPAVEHGKPAPDIFLTAARRLKREPATCLVFEDAPSGLQAGLAAGMRVIAVPDPNMNPERYATAHELLDSLQAFDPERWGLPAYTDRG
jgi:pseudouridine 5'-phosphatase